MDERRYDPKLIETIARARYEMEWEQSDWDDGLAIVKSAYLTDALALLATIDASGTHWVAPVEATEAMLTAAGWHDEYLGTGSEAWADMRAAYLTEETAHDAAAKAES